MVIRSDSPSDDKVRRFDELFDRYHREVFRYCVRRLGRADAEDATAEVFAVAWRRLEDVPDNQGRAWLLAVAYRIVGNLYRSRARQRRLIDRLQQFGGRSGEAPGGREDVDTVMAALEALRPADRELLCLVAWEGLTRAELASILGIRENAVDQRLFRARKRLRVNMQRSVVSSVDGGGR
jgi:RNA polymerase sigma-70 factor (ECF subfamily)